MSQRFDAYNPDSLTFNNIASILVLSDLVSCPISQYTFPSQKWYSPESDERFSALRNLVDSKTDYEGVLFKQFEEF